MGVAGSNQGPLHENYGAILMSHHIIYTFHLINTTEIEILFYEILLTLTKTTSRYFKIFYELK